MRSQRTGAIGRVLVVSFALSLLIAAAIAPVASAAQSTFNATPNATIPDNGYTGTIASMATSTITSSIPALRYVTDVTVQVGITHSWIGDLTIKLRSPSGTIFALVERPKGDGASNSTGDNGSDIGAGDDSNLVSTYVLSFNDTFTHDAEKMGLGLATAGTVCVDDGKCQYYPNPDQAQVVGNSVGSFGGFDGEPANGSWTLGVGDSVSADVGSFVTWGITIVHALSDDSLVSAAGVDFAIPDDAYNGTFASMTSATITNSSIPVGHVVTDVTVRVDITHTWLGDLTVKLRSPSGNILALMVRPQGDGGTNSPGDDGTDTSSPGDSSDLNSEYSLSFNDAFRLDPEQLGLGLDSTQVGCQDDGRCLFFPNPDQALASVADFSAFDGEDARGTWTLGIGDSAPTDVGTFVGWQLSLNYALPETSCSAPPFADVPVAHSFCREIKWMNDAGVSTGFGDHTYRPALPVTRQAMSAFMARLADAPIGPCNGQPFPDVATTHPFCPEIAWMKFFGISTGFPDGTYRPSAAVTRQAMSAFMARLAGADLMACSAAPFTDVPVSHPFCREIAWMKAARISEGFGDGTYRPAADVTRQAMSAFMNRVSDLLP